MWSAKTHDAHQLLYARLSLFFLKEWGRSFENFVFSLFWTSLFSGPVSWSLNSPIAFGNGENEPPFHIAVPEKAATLNHNPSQLSVAELARFDGSAVHRSSSTDENFVGVDDHEPEWVKNIEMTDNVKPVDSANLVRFFCIDQKFFYQHQVKLY